MRAPARRLRRGNGQGVRHRGITPSKIANVQLGLLTTRQLLQSTSRLGSPKDVTKQTRAPRNIYLPDLTQPAAGTRIAWQKQRSLRTMHIARVCATRPLYTTQMQETDGRLQQAIRAGNIGIFEHDHRTDALYWSPELRRMYGWDTEEPATLPKIIGHVHPEDVARVIAAVQAAHDPAGEGAFDIEHRIINRAGKLRWVLTRSKTQFEGAAGARRALRTIGAVQDVTDRKAAEERLRILDAVLSSSGQATAITDARGTVTFANAAVHRLWGYSNEQELIGRCLFDSWRLEHDISMLLERAQAGQVQAFEMPATRVDGSLFRLGVTAEAVRGVDGTLTQLLFSFADVTERHRTQQALRLKDQAIASSLTGLALADASGVLLYANHEFVRLWGFATDAELLGKSLWSLLEPFGASSVVELFARRAPFRGELAGKRSADGAALALDVSVHALLDAQGEPVNIVASMADVTERKRLEAQLVHAQKIESIGRLAGGVAHDFNNLLTVISGGLELSLADLPAGHSSREHLAEAANAAQSAAALTRQLLAFSRKEVIAPKVLDLNAVIQRVQKMILRLVGEDIALSTLCAANLAPIRFDPAQVEQIIVNLAVNARDAMQSGGKLTIETSNVRLDAEYAEQHLGAQPGDYVLLAVSDDGAGMSEDVRSHLFEPFFTTKEAGKGTGLGLAMVYGAVQQNGGRIEVYSEVGRGTSFKIYLPAQVATGEALPESAGIRLSRSTSILLVEDDARVRGFAQTALTRLGHVVHAFPNGEAALAALGSLTPTPELLMTDVVMPGVNGHVLAQRIAAVLPTIRVLFVSGYTQNVIVNQGVLKQGIEFLAKPYSVEQLARRIAELLEKA
jgi:PAS domain S-box-containing protein